MSRWTWLALLGVGSVLAGVLVWATVANLPTRVDGAGYVVPSAGWRGIQATTTGVVRSMVATSVQVRAGQTVAVIVDSASSEEVPIVASVAGVVAESNVTAGQFVRAGDQLAIMSPQRPGLVVYAYFPVSSSISPSATTNVAVDGTPAAAFGYIRGRVVSVATLPATAARVQQVLLNSALANQVMKHGPVIEVVIRLQTGPTPSGYEWTEGGGPAFSPVRGGAAVRVSVVVDRKHPISYVL